MAECPEDETMTTPTPLGTRAKHDHDGTRCRHQRYLIVQEYTEMYNSSRHLLSPVHRIPLLFVRCRDAAGVVAAVVGLRRHSRIVIDSVLAIG